MGCHPRMPPWDAAPPASPFSFHDEERHPTPWQEKDVALKHMVEMGRAIGWNCCGVKEQLSRSAFLGVGRRRVGGEKEAGKRTWERDAPCQDCNSLQDVEMLVSLKQCIIPQRNGPFPIRRHQNLNYIYIYNYNYSNISIYLSYLYMYTLKSVTALARNTEEKYWRCHLMQVVALTEVLWRVSTTRKGTTRFWESKCCWPNTAVGNKDQGLSGANEGRWGQIKFWPCWRQKNQGIPRKNSRVRAGWLVPWWNRDQNLVF